MAKAKPIVIKTGNTFKGPGWDKKLPDWKPEPASPKKVFDPKR